jgi:RIO kinase 2
LLVDLLKRERERERKREREREKERKKERENKSVIMKLDPTVLRTMVPQDFQVLEAIEKGMAKHALVPSPLIASLANLRHGGTNKILSSLLRDKLLSHDQSCGYDGYRITTAGYDILTLHNLKTRKMIAAIGDRIGTGKESDVYLAVRPNGEQVVLKFHRLGRTSFRNVKKTRDYFVATHQKGRNTGETKQNQGNSWLFLSRKSALKEFAFMKALYSVDYPTPVPIGHNRHIVVMSLIRGVPLYQVIRTTISAEQASSIFHQASDLALRLAKHGLVHCDLNEFNLIVDLSGIQQSTLSTEHDHYARHSGMSVAAESNPGMLSARGPWEPENLHKFQPDIIDEGAAINPDEPQPVPAEYLDNGEPRPVVTLIDFPQMVSTLHPNACELYERDTNCLLKFFTHKLQFQIPQSELESLCLSWESVSKVLEEQKQQEYEQIDINDDNDDDGASVGGETTVSTTSTCLTSVSKAQLRLDVQMQASGYSTENAKRKMDLKYFSNQIKEETDEEEEDDDDDEDDDESNDDDNNSDSAADNNDNANDNDTDNDNDDDGLSIKSHDDDNVSISPSMISTSNMSIMTTSQLANLTRAQLEQQARLRVQLHLDKQKKINRQRGAFRKRNTNKAYSKGKRVYNEPLDGI